MEVGQPRKGIKTKENFSLEIGTAGGDLANLLESLMPNSSRSRYILIISEIGEIVMLR